MNEDLEHLLLIIEEAHPKNLDKLRQDLLVIGLPDSPEIFIERFIAMNHIIVINDQYASGTSLRDSLPAIESNMIFSVEELNSTVPPTSKYEVPRIIDLPTIQLSKISKHNNKTTLRIKARSNLPTKPKPD
jgi:hypothetical protein